MRRLVYLAVPFHGHVYPSLSLILGLVTRGYEVHYYAPEKFRDSLEAVGATFHAYQSIIDSGTIHIPPTMADPPISGVTNISESLAVIPQTFASIEALKPDCIIYDYMCLWGQLIVQKLGIPAVKFYVTFPENEHFNILDYYCQVYNLPPPPAGAIYPMTPAIRSDLDRLAALCEIPSVDFPGNIMQCEPLNIVPMPQALHPQGETFDERFLFVGSLLRPVGASSSWGSRLHKGMPTVYVSLGTALEAWPAFYRMCLTAFRDPVLQIVLSLGPKVDARMLGSIPAHILTAAHVPQLEILTQTDVFITHGGTNSVVEALFYGVPMIVIPQTIEHSVFARRIVELKLGIALEKRQVSPRSLREAVYALLNNKDVKRGIQQMRERMLEAGGHQKAVEAISRYLSSKGRGKEGKEQMYKNYTSTVKEPLL